MPGTKSNPILSSTDSFVVLPVRTTIVSNQDLEDNPKDTMELKMKYLLTYYVDLNRDF